MSTFAYQQRSFLAHSARVSRMSKKTSNGTKLDRIQIVLMAVIAVFGVCYLLEVNSLATKGYQINDLQHQVADLQQQNSDLQVQSLSLQSMDSMKEKVSSLDMVAAGSADYVASGPVAVAR